MHAWCGWYHVNGNTYGTWLPGDPRGWREKHHRRHVNGDYKNPPPPGSGDRLHTYARSRLKWPPVRLSPVEREIVGESLVEMLTRQDVEVLAVCVDAVHFHILAKFPDSDVRPRVGRAKKHAYHVLRDHGRVRKLWGRGCRALPITDRKHQLNVFRYISRHRDKGAWVWTFGEGLYWHDIADG
ncbi:MAG: hypothetical protein WBC53_02880 [Phycisphaerae bacterium]